MQDSVLSGESLRDALIPRDPSVRQIKALHQSCVHLLSVASVDSYINSVPATVSEDSMETEIDDNKYYARLFSMKDETGVLVHGIVFDTDKDIDVTTPNDRALFFSNLGGGIALRAENDFDPKINDPHHFDLANRLVANLRSKQNIRETKIAAKTAAELAKKEKQLAEQNARQQELHQERRQARRHTAKRVGKTLLYTAISAGMLYGGSKISWEGIFDDFDEKYLEGDFRLSGGTALAPGQTGHPAFSARLYGDERLTDEQVPNTTQESKSGTYSSIKRDMAIRDALIPDVPDGKEQECFTIDIPDETKPALDTKLVLWTDYVDKEGEDLAKDITVTYRVDEIGVCRIKSSAEPANIGRVVFGFLQADQ